MGLPLQRSVSEFEHPCTLESDENNNIEVKCLSDEY